MDRKAHWETIYAGKQPEQLTWYQAVPQQSLRLVEATGVPVQSQIIDVGGGTSRLVDYLLEAGYQNLTVLDIAEGALARNKERLCEQAERVSWIAGDIMSVPLPEHSYDVWHDRAVFHFLTDRGDRQTYVDVVRRSLKPGGHLILSTFAHDGPERCSGLAVVRYGEQDICSEFGAEFELLHSVDEDHTTPWDTTQKFTFFHFRQRV